jgi:membrane-bound metal-dependent hydrolase YbcI (DUF457 family)
MTWKHHSIFAASLTTLLGMNLVEVVYCTCLAGLPDQMERIGRVRLFRHRTLTHDLGLWGGACVLLYYLVTAHYLPDRLIVSTWALPLPGVMHLLGDVLTPFGINFLGIKIRFPLFKTGSLVEWAFVLLMALTALMGAPNLSHFRHEFFPF